MIFLLPCLLGIIFLTAPTASADSNSSLLRSVKAEWGGRVKVQGAASFPKQGSYYEPVGLSPMLDGFADLRLKNRFFIGDHFVTEVHYEAVLSGGEGRRRRKDLERKSPDIFGGGLTNTINDDRRLMNLTWTLAETDGLALYNRLDRLNLTIIPGSGPVHSLTLGRQAVTWGDGLVFNPMDLINPFAPTDIERDYKVGDDMLLIQFNLKHIDGLQFVFAPGRDVSSGEMTLNSSTLGGKLDFSIGETEFDLMLAKRLRDAVLGVGAVGYLGDAAWRINTTLTFLENPAYGSLSVYPSIVANMDYSWVWFDKNFYGFIELYYNGLSNGQYQRTAREPAVADRLARGEIFALGRFYASTHVEMEVHPLLHLHLTAIANLEDPSGVLQPRAVWSLSQNMDATLGANIIWGGPGSEYGGFGISEFPYSNRRPDTAYCWLNYYF